MNLQSFIAGFRRSSLPHNLRTVDDQTFVLLSYQMILRRNPDKNGFSHYVDLLANNRLSREGMVDQLIDSEEFTQNWQFNRLGTSVHQSRIRFVKSLPPAKAIVDLGGGSPTSDFGTLVELGYMYDFTTLTVVDLPDGSEQYKTFVQSGKGRVNYLYQPLSNLQPLADSSIDLVYTQSLAKMEPSEAIQAYEEIIRVLRPGGYFCLDTPNARITMIQQDRFIDPEHKIAYTHQDLSAQLTAAGFKIREAKGLNYVGQIEKRSQFSPKDVAKNSGIYWDIENCYMLAYVCQKPNTRH